MAKTKGKNMKAFKWVAAIFAVAALGVGLSSLFVVAQYQTALVLQFGEVVGVQTTPGLKVKIPFIQNVLFYDKRLLSLDPPVERVVLADQKPLLVDSYARYKITNPRLFYERVRDESVLNVRLVPIMSSSLRSVLGGENLASILSSERRRIMDEITARVSSEANRFGITVVDVRIRRADLPPETSEAVYSRMRSEREREARDFRARGEEDAKEIQAKADREVTVIAAEAERDAQILRGEGDAARVRILNDAYGKDQDFFAFYRSILAYRNSLKDSYLVLSPEDGIFSSFLQIIEDGGLVQP